MTWLKAVWLTSWSNAASFSARLRQMARSGSVKTQVPTDSLVGQIERLRATTWRWQRVMSRPLTAGSVTYRTDPSLHYRRWVRNLYRFAMHPNLAFYFRVPLDVALGRILGGRNALKYYEAGMDLDLSRNIEESFRIFQGRILEEYEAMAGEMGFHVIDATKSIERQQKEMRRIFLDELGDALPNGVLEAHKVQTHA